MIPFPLQASRLALAASLSLLSVMAGTAIPATAEGQAYRVANTAVVSGNEAHLEVQSGELDQRIVYIERLENDEELLLDIGTPLKLWRIPDGLARIAWPHSEGMSLSREDAIALSGRDSAADVPTWGADVSWPELGPVMLILFEVGPESYGGLLSSAPAGIAVMRQMMFQTVDPRARPRTGHAHEVPLGVETLPD
ncbi:hypothetical protein [Stappia indica]|uniref:Uncharacterized protein n=1 Tax=Stappia indica TaxID=538381 RepID=A0A285TKC4_9HYPH|nr:hypothetical protein [Stappia indica]SOC22985.1 hypothetical protein SAMN05421512_112213 [Stappia indica]